jgi:hypothetical protein
MGRRRWVCKVGSYTRRLRLEPLEARRLLAITVTTNLDVVDLEDGVVSLREAIAEANSVAGPDTIEFDFGHDGPETIVLTQGELAITDSLTIHGTGASLLTIDASGNDPTPDSNFEDGDADNDGDGSRIFHVNDGNASVQQEVTIAGLTLTGGDVVGDGGAVLNRENLSINGCVIVNNVAEYALTPNWVTLGHGGGVANLGGTLTIEECEIIGNQTRQPSGGGVRNSAGQLIIRRSFIGANVAPSGSGISTVGGSASIEDTEIVGNRLNAFIQLSGVGGGIYSSDSQLNVSRSTVARHGGYSAGAGIHSSGGTLHIAESTIGENWLANSNLLRKGAGIYRDTQSVVTPTTFIEHSTIAENLSNFAHGAGVFIEGMGALALKHSIIARNFTGVSGPGPNGQHDEDVHGMVHARYSLIGDSTDAVITDLGGNLIGVRTNKVHPKLGPLQQNGGPTSTYMLLAESPAINAGDPAALAGMNGVPVFDPRAEPWGRVVGGRIDMGAVEAQANPLTGDYNFNGVVDAADYSVWIDTQGSTNDLRADGDGDGSVDAEDYGVWKTHFGEVLEQEAGSMEPGENGGGSLAASQRVAGDGGEEIQSVLAVREDVTREIGSWRAVRSRLLAHAVAQDVGGDLLLAAFARRVKCADLDAEIEVDHEEGSSAAVDEVFTRVGARRGRLS